MKIYAAGKNKGGYPWFPYSEGRGILRKKGAVGIQFSRRKRNKTRGYAEQSFHGAGMIP